MTNELTPVRCGCGGEAQVRATCFFTATDLYLVQCKRCGTATLLKDTEAEAIDVWNKAMGKDKRSDLAITKGYWMVTYDGLHCSICNYKLDTTAVPDICPCCGSEMKP